MCQGPARARTVLVNGEIVVDDGALKQIDTAALYAEANRLAAGMIERMTARTGLTPLVHRAAARS
jgi:hypothetical protein